MSDEVFRPMKPQSEQPEGPNPLDRIREIQGAVAEEVGEKNPMPDVAPFQMHGKIPPALRKAMEQKGQLNKPSARPKRPAPESKIRMQSSDALESLLRQLAERHTWEEFEFISGGRFYTDIPPVIHVRPMTGEEEQILATPRFVRKNKAIDMIFQRCVEEQINTENLLSLDRTHLLIYLRGISYTPDYDVEVKCPQCQTAFSTVIDLNSLEVNPCPEDFNESSLHGVLPNSGFKYEYRLANGSDEVEISNYREKRISMFGDQAEDDTLLYRTALLLNSIEDVTDKRELALLLKRLPINDVSHLRNEINEPPFGVDTEIPMVCPNCSHEFKIDLPFDTNFFFPRKKEKTQA